MIEKCSADYLRKIVNDCSNQLQRLLQDPSLSSAQKGTLLASAVTKRLRNEKGVGFKGLRRIHVSHSFSTFAGFQKELAAEEIESFVRRRPNLARRLRELEQLFWRKPRNGKPYKRRLGRLMPDLIVELEDGSVIIWDLTSKTKDEHIAKTLLYAEIAEVAGGGRYIQIGEFHWAPPASAASAGVTSTTIPRQGASNADRF